MKFGFCRCLYREWDANSIFLPPSMPALDVLFHTVQQHQSLLSGIAIGLVIFLTIRYFQSPWRKLPPGPTGLPLIGNVLEIRSKQWLNFMRWKREFGPLLSGFSSYFLIPLRRHFLPQCSRSTYNRPQYSEGRSRFT
jgi:hypothetical protein